MERLERAGLTVTAGRSTRLHVDLRLAGAAILVRGFRQGSTMERTVPARVDECVSVERVVAALIQSWAQIIQPLAEPDQAASSQRSTTVDAGVAGLRGLTAGTGVEAPPARSRRASDSVSRAPSEASGSVGREAGRLGSAGPAPESGVAPVGSPRMPSDDQTERFDDVRAVDVNPTPESATRAPSADQTGRLEVSRAVSVGRTLESAVAPMGSPRTPSADQTDRLEGSRAASVRRTPESAVAPVGSPRPSSADQTDRAEARAASLARTPESVVAPVVSPRTPSADRLEEPVAVSVGRTPQSAADPANSPLAASPRSEQPGAASVSPTMDAVQVGSASANPTPGLAPARANAPLAASADRTPRREESQSSPVGPVPTLRLLPPCVWRRRISRASRRIRSFGRQALRRMRRA